MHVQPLIAAYCNNLFKHHGSAVKRLKAQLYVVNSTKSSCTGETVLQQPRDCFGIVWLCLFTSYVQMGGCIFLAFSVGETQNRIFMN
jgi:hypothetical protein